MSVPPEQLSVLPRSAQLASFVSRNCGLLRRLCAKVCPRETRETRAPSRNSLEISRGERPWREAQHFPARHRDQLWVIIIIDLSQSTHKMKAHFILYVTDQQRSTAFYSFVLGEAPVLNVPGMTEFRLEDSAVLGLMPETGIVDLLGATIVHPSSAHGAPRSELYLVVENAAAFHARAIAAGGRELSCLSLRDWGHFVAYSVDPDGHVLAFASLANPAA